MVERSKIFTYNSFITKYVFKLATFAKLRLIMHDLRQKVKANYNNRTLVQSRDFLSDFTHAIMFKDDRKIALLGSSLMRLTDCVSYLMKQIEQSHITHCTHVNKCRVETSGIYHIPHIFYSSNMSLKQIPENILKLTNKSSSNFWYPYI